MSQQATTEFGKLRSIFWPIHGHELKKVIPMFLMFFCISFNYTILRDTKDTLVVGSSGAETIAFLKFWGVIPCAVIFMMIYAKLSNVLSKERLFYVTLTPFLIFFALFTTVLYPFRESLHPTETANYLQSVLPDGFSGLIAIFRNWTFSVFYVLSELWGSVVLSLLFWSFANEITKVTEAKRFYGLFGIGANLALLVSGPIIVFFSNIKDKVAEGVDPWQVTLNWLMLFVVVAGVLIMVVYRYMNKNVITDTRYYDPTQVKKKKSKPKLGMMESFRFLFTSKYLGCLALLVIGYGICINLVEVTWKSQLKVQYPNYNDYQAFMGYFSTVTGAVTTFMMLFVAHNVLRRFGWTVAAIITPIVLLVTGGLFFNLVMFKDSLLGLVAMLGTSPLMLAVLFGAAQNIMSKATKYSLFDPTKEMAYIPLDQELKYKGKAAVDVVGARLGKSGGSLIQQGLILGFGSLAAITPYVAVIMTVFIVVWIFAAKSLGKQFHALNQEQEAQTAATEAEKAVEVKEEKETATTNVAS